jgi:UDP-glucose 4-epimerase
MSKETILVTGGAGYIGSHTIIALIDLSAYDIVSVDNYSNSNARTYDRIEQITGKRVAFIEADVAKREEVEKIFAQFPEITGVIHFAAYKSVPESVAHPEMYFRNNLDSLTNVLETGKKHKLKNVIFSSSCSVYGNIDQLPVSETTPLSKAESPYAETKLLGEKIMQETISASTQMKGISLRYFNPVGAHPSGLIGELPNQRPNNLVPVITQTAIGKIPAMHVFGDDYPTRDGTCIRDYIHVCDIAEAHVLAMKRLIDDPSAPRYDVFNLGSGNGVTVLEAIHAFEKVSGRKLNYVLTERRAGDVTAIYSDSSKAKNILSWETKRSLEEMMASAWKWEQYLATENAVH